MQWQDSNTNELQTDAWGVTGYAETCMACYGLGYDYEEACLTCGGFGFVVYHEVNEDEKNDTAG